MLNSESVIPLSEEDVSCQSFLHYFGIDKFRANQEKAVNSILNNQNPLLIMPTGGGKSLCYQLPALMLFKQQKGLTVVISPLQALMADQVIDLENKGLNFATFINANLKISERHERIQQILDGTIGLIYISPEQLRSLSIRSLFEERPPSLWVIDEAHCISQWGHDFRPDYRYIPKFIKELLYKNREYPLPLPRLALMTATATVAVRQDIKQLLSNYEINIQELDNNSIRENLKYDVRPVSSETEKETFIIKQVQKILTQQDGCVLVYTTTRKKAEKLAAKLNKCGIKARHYHGKIPKYEKEEVLQEFKSKELNVVTATCAFGMGINRDDVRAVIHHSMSANLENYIQESGRAGRDEKPAICSLLFNPEDADTIFFLQSLNQLNETDLKNIFIAIRNIRDILQIQKGNSVYEGEFWITTNEIYQSSDLDDDFASEDDQRDTKIKVALYHLENFKLIERAENLSTFIQFELLCSNSQESLSKFKKYSHTKCLHIHEIELLNRLIEAMHIVKSYYHRKGESITIDKLTDESGISIKDLQAKIRILEESGICTFEIPLNLLINKAVTGDARKNHQRLRKLEEELLKSIFEVQTENSIIQLNLKGLASRLDNDGTQKIRAATLKSLIETWANQKWVELTITGKDRDTVRLKWLNTNENILNAYQATQAITLGVIEVIYQKLSQESKEKGKFQVKYELGQLLKDVAQKIQQKDLREVHLEQALMWLHRQKLIRITEGLNLFYQSLKVKVIKDANIRSISPGYSKQIRPHYEEQARRTHIMIKYGEIDDNLVRQQLVQDYFDLPSTEFYKLYSDLNSPEKKLPVIEPDIIKILGLNESQKNIVLSESPAIAVIAGPGSGKTRTIVRRIAYLVKVKRVDPNRILVLAYNRNAVRELRKRLFDLIGTLASRLRVFTFHGLALALLGRTAGEIKRSKQNAEESWNALLKEVCELISNGDELDDGDSQARRIQLLGNVEYIFVDEYQDVAEDEYRMIQLLAGLGESEDKSRSVQINLCVIGDDDQNIYSFRGTNPQYIIQFTNEYKATQFLLAENYRSTESIIETANCLIQHNQIRCKQHPDEQVRIDQERIGLKGQPVLAYKFSNLPQQAAWVKNKIQSWIDAGIKHNEIAILAREWDYISPIRLLLERENIPSYALNNTSISLVNNYSTRLLIHALKGNITLVTDPEESILERFKNFFGRAGRNLLEPTVKTLLKIAEDLDKERGYGSEDLVLPMSIDEILTAIFESNKTGETFLENDSILVTSCHGAKGLEFRKVILLSDGFKTNSQDIEDIESERRLFYVAMTRAKEELILCSTQQNLFIQQAGLTSQITNYTPSKIPPLMHYFDLTPADVNLGHEFTRNRQGIIRRLLEGTSIILRTNDWGNGWSIFTQDNNEIGALSRGGTQSLRDKGIHPGQFEFQFGEVTVRYIYNHTKIDEVTGDLLENWFVIIPQIRVCR
ncbi:RecQ family ATP-dependent DNA helicase [Dolichospermum sp. ST_sed1]|nr:RecQ family ATP-dependent DNA helicase [Dolichospermum sp. ST_sed1]MDD1427006.1 RecQ family ATP-dependent DNA helicase [Dolichospermum sp. ST_sed9]MDD1433572.1 RecQ family ATP-dependent DNA helicase [Dolichospermum sp. ST_sed6]MDD1442865.1 RecQ family ATP-dependent DNA helicase [Dolichospermum sp. ST_sed3]MDD1448568.1 RecQ family ATP-dependent DNA helicase [Dolichospermum sp. ST_sed8]MDD1457092.1 RecQ family ATP-dependent DNA helicase [Dolichospermum sp. ST_sed7]MDD1462626.1 RecQ family AT